MAQAVLNRVLTDVEALEPEELRSVERVVQDQLRAAEYGYSREEWVAMQALTEAGLLKEIKPRRRGSVRLHAPVPIQGKPLSETVVEERR